jgi:hypothetical protein
MNKFHAEKSKYLSEFKIDNIKIEESCMKADDYLNELKRMAIALKDSQFNGELVEFIKNETKYETEIIGSFDFQLLKLVHMITLDLESYKV